MKTFQFLLGLAILVAVLWTATAPANAEAESLIGGWDPYIGCSACDRLTWLRCESGNYFYCSPGDFVGLVWGPYFHKCGSPNGSKACRGPGGSMQCYDFFNSTLSCD